MNKVFRWQGVVAFIVLLGLLYLFSAFLLDRIVKYAIESTASQAVGAEVNVGEVSHRFSPFGFTLSKIEITDPSAPENNQLQIGSASAEVDLLPFVMGKVIIDELILDEVLFQQPRRTPGEVFRAPGETVIDQFAPEDIELPSVDEILAKSPLRTTQAAEQAQAAYQQHKDAVSQAYAALPDKAQLKEYQARLKALRETDYKDPAALVKAKQEFEQIKAQLTEEKQKFDTFQQTLSDAKADLTPKIAALRAAPGEDYDLLKGLVAGDAAAFGDITEAVFGNQARKWSDTLFSALDIVGPMLAKRKQEQQEAVRASGVFYTFNDESGLPDLLIKRARVNIKWQQQTLLSDWFNITTDHTQLGEPTRFEVRSESSPLWQHFAIDGTLSLLADGVHGQQKWQLQGVVLEQLGLSNNPKLSALLQTGLLSSNGQLTVAANALEGAGDIQLSQLTIDAQGSNKLTNAIASALNDLSLVTLRSDIAGSLTSPSFDLASDLDNQLATALTASLGSEAKAKLERLQQSLDERAAATLGPTSQGLTQWLDFETVANGDLGNLEEMLKSQMQDQLDKKKQQLKDKLTDKIFG